MSNFIQRRSSAEITLHTLFYAKANPDGTVFEEGCGYGFPCDAHGVVHEAALRPEALANLQACRAGTLPVRPPIIRPNIERVITPAIIECDHCGHRLTLDDAMTNTCQCGLEYNGSGQALAPRDQWGEETGEDYRDLHAL